MALDETGSGGDDGGTRVLDESARGRAAEAAASAFQAPPSYVNTTWLLAGAFVVLMTIFASIGFYLGKRSASGVSEDEMAQVVKEFPAAMTRMVAEKRQDAKVTHLEIKRKELEQDGTIRLDYLLTMDEAEEGGEVATNTLDQIAILSKKDGVWIMTSVDAKSQELTFQSGLMIEGRGTAPASVPAKEESP